MLVAASPRQFLSFDQWDVHQDDLLEIDAILSINSINESFWKYLHHPRNPSSNFEVYLNGWDIWQLLFLYFFSGGRFGEPLRHVFLTSLFALLHLRLPEEIDRPSTF